MNRGRLVRSVGLLSGLLLLAGCATISAETAGGATAVVGASASEGMDGLLIGTISIEEGCWVIVADDVVHHILWPTGTAVADEGTLVPDVTGPLSEGSAVQASGGEIPAADVPGVTDECWSEDDFVFSAWHVEREG